MERHLALSVLVSVLLTWVATAHPVTSFAASEPTTEVKSSASEGSSSWSTSQQFPLPTSAATATGDLASGVPFSETSSIGDINSRLDSEAHASFDTWDTDDASDHVSEVYTVQYQESTSGEVTSSAPEGSYLDISSDQKPFLPSDHKNTLLKAPKDPPEYVKSDVDSVPEDDVSKSVRLIQRDVRNHSDIPADLPAPLNIRTGKTSNYFPQPLLNPPRPATGLKPPPLMESSSAAKVTAEPPVVSATLDGVTRVTNTTTAAVSEGTSSTATRVADEYVPSAEPPVQGTSVLHEDHINSTLPLADQEVNETVLEIDEDDSNETTILPTVAPITRERVAEKGWTPFLDAGSISGIVVGVVLTTGLAATAGVILYRRRLLNKPQTLHDKCSNPDSSGYIDDSTLRENSEEMYSLDNDSFLNSLEAMTIQNYWTDNVKHTKL